MDVLKEALIKVKPSKEDEVLVDKRIKEFMSKIKAKDAKAILGGSGAKGTWLKSTNDADIFIQFNYNKYKDKSDRLSDVLEKQLKKYFKRIIRLHGSRDYFQIIEHGFTFEIVPILEIKNSKDAINITDVSPLHAKFVKEAIIRNKKLADEIRLMKQFCKANKVYGAESYINGFSGYMCELLTTYYGSFLGLIKAAAKWKGKVLIDIKKFYKGKDILMEMNKSKTYSPIVLVDPVQSDRNAAAALSNEKYELFISKAKEFLKRPSIKFFEKEEFNTEKLKKDFIIIEADVLSGKEDIVGAKTLKVFEFLKNSLIKKGFELKESGWEWNKGKTSFSKPPQKFGGKGEKAYFYLKNMKDLDKEEIIEGPPTRLKDFVDNFKKNHNNTFVKKNIIYAKEKRKFTKAKDYVKELLKNDYVKERVKSAKVL